MASQHTHTALVQFYDVMTKHFGPMHWWPGDTPFEVIIGAILTQNTAWTNVEKCITAIKNDNAMDPYSMHVMPDEILKEMIRSSGYYNQKTKKIRAFLDFFHSTYNADIDAMKRQPIEILRPQLLSLFGIGPETADSILLYALDKPVFVIDAYTRRILSRHHLINPSADYETIRSLFEDNLDRDVQLYNEYHALIVNLGKDFCGTKPRCEKCPLRQFLRDDEQKKCVGN